jgi:hypothetical protein
LVASLRRGVLSAVKHVYHCAACDRLKPYPTGANDRRYFARQCLTFDRWNPRQLIGNADSVAGYLTMLNKIFAIVAAFLVSSSAAFACTASENVDIYFARNSDQVPNDEVIRLANWVDRQKIAYASHKSSESTLVSGHGEEDERNAASLSKRRLSAGIELLSKFGFLRGEVVTSARVYSHRDVENGRRVEISFEPDCPNKCCDGK